MARQRGTSGRRIRWHWWLAGGVLTVFAGLVAIGIAFPPDPAPGSKPSPTASASPSSSSHPPPAIQPQPEPTASEATPSSAVPSVPDTPEPPDTPAPATSSAPTNVNYKDCDAARAAGAAPLYAGQPGYRSALDRDGDGVAYEPYVP
ncbi:excalibur calcium-binding domain-containing protein [Streptomyces sp. ASQP_92]|uniref:excalibur calcium-binding domain-containing protein n=1 Tax=Streptomyces sp. ASQP_92 TaxID=2979116 RepID=UPI0021C069A4|nr:excalibur calcium-binding domain-containing protein [Streptomyces sp. ASQP_92]MCT9092865.1 excalibur calcium-binding domain-containing protein [Streptomyces sp. ASQP_92]